MDEKLFYYDISEEVTAFSTMRGAELPFFVLQPHQVHDDKIVAVERRDMTREDLEGVDALMTDLRGFAISVRTADCVPVLLYDAKKKAVAAVHSGWKGTVKKISQKTISEMTDRYGTDPKELTAVIGPCIGPESFQVGEEVVAVFRDNGFPMDEILSYEGEKIAGTMRGGWHINLWRANEWLLEQSGVKRENIQVSEICTYQRNDLFYSARREGTKCGRIINAIMLK